MIFLRDASEKQWEDEIVAGRELRNGRSCWIFATGRASPPRSIPALRVSQRTRTIVSWCRLYGRKWNETVFLVKIGKGDSREHKSLFFFSSLVRVRRRTHALHRNCATLVFGDSRRMWYSRRYSTSFSRKKGKERTGRSVRSVLLDAFLYFLLGLLDLVPSLFFSKLFRP